MPCKIHGFILVYAYQKLKNYQWKQGGYTYQFIYIEYEYINSLFLKNMSFTWNHCMKKSKQ